MNVTVCDLCDRNGGECMSLSPWVCVCAIVFCCCFAVFGLTINTTRWKTFARSPFLPAKAIVSKICQPRLCVRALECGRGEEAGRAQLLLLQRLKHFKLFSCDFKGRPETTNTSAAFKCQSFINTRWQCASLPSQTSRSNSQRTSERVADGTHTRHTRGLGCLLYAQCLDNRLKWPWNTTGNNIEPTVGADTVEMFPARDILIKPVFWTSTSLWDRVGRKKWQMNRRSVKRRKQFDWHWKRTHTRFGQKCFAFARRGQEKTFRSSDGQIDCWHVAAYQFLFAWMTNNLSPPSCALIILGPKPNGV